MISCLWLFRSRKAGCESLAGLSQSCRCSGTDRMFSISAAECEVLPLQSVMILLGPLHLFSARFLKDQITFKTIVLRH